MRKLSVAICFFILLLSAIPSEAFDSSLVNETQWSVAGFDRGNMGKYHSVPWVFHANKQVSAHNLWAGVWTAVGENKIVVSIALTNGQIDMFEVIFVSPYWLVAVKNNEIYRLGRRR